MDFGRFLNSLFSHPAPWLILLMAILLFYALVFSAFIIFYLYKFISKRWRERPSIEPLLERWFIKIDEGINGLLNNWLMRYKAASILVVAVLILLLLWLLPVVQSTNFRSDFDSNNNGAATFRDPPAKMAFDVANESRKTIAQILGGIAALVAFYFMWQRNYITQQGQITDRFTKAVEQLGSDDIAVRLGGIYALERIAKDSEPDHWQVMEVLTAYVREKKPVNPKEDDRLTKTDFNYVVSEILNRLKSTTSPAPAAVPLAEDTPEPETVESKKPELPKDIQAILTVIARRLHADSEGDKRIDFSNTDLRGADLSKKGEQEVNLKKINFAGANLSGVSLTNANLHEAIFIEAQLQGADLSGANLQGANLEKAQLQEATLWATRLQGANLRKAQLQGAVLREAQLQGANLRKAQLQGAFLESTKMQCASLAEAGLQGATFFNADLSGACFENAKVLGADFSTAVLDGVYFWRINNTTQDRTDWDKLPIVNSIDIRERVESAQNVPLGLPQVLCSRPYITAFIEINKNLALKDSYIAQALLDAEQPYYFNENELSYAYETIAAHIREHLPENLRQEIIARGHGALLAPPPPKA